MLFELRQGDNPITVGAFLVGCAWASLLGLNGEPPTRRQVADRAGIHMPNVTRYVKELKRKGYQIDTSKGYQGDTTGGINLIPEEYQSDTSLARDNSNNIKIIQEKKEKEKEKSKPKKKKKILSAKKFESFWKIYPRKIAKAQAVGAWNARVRDGLDLDAIIRAVKNYAIARSGEEQQFTLHPSTFINGRWRDYLNPPKKNTTHDAQNDQRGGTNYDRYDV